MLKVLRNNTKLIIWIIVISFVLWGVSSTIVTSLHQNKSLGSVFGKRVSQQQFDAVYKALYLSPRIQSMIREKGELPRTMLIQATFQHIALLQEAKKRKITVSDKDVRGEILRRFSPQGTFEPRLYERWVANVAQQPIRQYEEGVRNDLYIRKLMESLENSITVDDSEVQEYYQRNNRSLALETLFVSRDLFAKNITPSEEELKTFYQSHLDNFKTEPIYQLMYVAFETKNYGTSLTISDEELFNYFEEHKEQFQQNNVPLSFTDVKPSIETLVKEEKARSLAREEAKSFYSKALSAETLTDAVQGTSYAVATTQPLPLQQLSAELGNARELESFLLEPSITEKRLIESASGYFIIQLQGFEPSKLIDFTSCIDKVRTLLVTQTSFAQAETRAKEIALDLPQQTKMWKELAETYACTYKELPTVTAQGSPEDPALSTVAFRSLWNKPIGTISEPLPIEETGYALVKLISITDPPQEDFEKNKEDIKTRLTEFKRYFAVQQEASSILERAAIAIAPHLTDSIKAEENL